MRYDYDGYHYMNGQEPMAWIFMIFIIVLVTLTIVWIVRTVNYDAGARQNQALELLKRRFAAGEIDEAEYEKKRKLIE